MTRLKCVRTLQLLGILLSLLPICTAAPRIDAAEPEPSTTTPPTASWIPKFFKQQLDLLNKVLAESGAAPIDKEDVGKIFATNNATSAAPQIASSIASGAPPALSSTAAAVSAEPGSALREMQAMFNLSSATTPLPASFSPLFTAPLQGSSPSSPAPSVAEATGTTPAAASKSPANALREMLAMFNLSSQAPASASNTATTALPAPFNSMTTAPPASSNLPFPFAPSSPEASATPEATMSSGIASQMPADHGNGSTTSGSVEFSSQAPAVVSATESSSLLSPAAEAMTSTQPATGFSNEVQQPSELANVTGSSASKAAATTAAQQLNGEFSTVTLSAALEGRTMPEYPVQQAATEQPSLVSTSVGPQIEAPTGEITSAHPLASGETAAPGALQQSVTTPAASAEGPSAEPSKEAQESTRPSGISVSTGGFSESPGPGMKPTKAHSKQPSATSPANVQQEGTEGAKQQTASEGFTAAPNHEVSGQFQGMHTTLPFSHVSSATGTSTSKGQLSSSHLMANVTATKSPSKASSANVTMPHVESTFNATKSKKPTLTRTSEAPSFTSEHPSPVSPSASPQIEAPTEEATSAFPAASGEKTDAGELQQSITTPATSAEAQSAEPSNQALGLTRTSEISSPARGSSETSGPNSATATSLPNLKHEATTQGPQQENASEGLTAAPSQEMSVKFQGKHTTLPFSRVSGATGTAIRNGQLTSSHLTANVTATKSPSKASSASVTRPRVESAFNATKSKKPAMTRTSEAPLLASEHPPPASPSASPQMEASTEETTSAFPVSSREITAPGELQQSLTTLVTSAEAQSAEPSEGALGSTRSSAISQPASGSTETPSPSGSAATSFPGLQHETATQGEQQQETPESFPTAASHEVSGQVQGRRTTLPFSRVSGATASAAVSGQRLTTNFMANVTATKSPHKASSANITRPHVESSFNATKSKKPALSSTTEAPLPVSGQPSLASPSASPGIDAPAEATTSLFPATSGEKTATGEFKQSMTTPATSAEALSAEPSKEASGSTSQPGASGSAETPSPNGSAATSVPGLQQLTATQGAQQQGTPESSPAAASHEVSGQFHGKHTTLPFSRVSGATETGASEGQRFSSQLMANVTATKRPSKASSTNVAMPHVESSVNATKSHKPALNGTSEEPSLNTEHPLVSPSASTKIEAPTEENASASPIASGEKTAAAELQQSITTPATSAEAQSEEPSNEALGSPRPPEVSGPSGGSPGTPGPNGPTAASLPSFQNEAATQFAHQHTVSEGLLAAASHGHSGPFQGRHTTLPLSRVPAVATASTVNSAQLSSSHLIANVTAMKSPHKASTANVTMPQVQSSFNATKGRKPALNGTSEAPSQSSEQSFITPTVSPELEGAAEAVTISLLAASQEKTAPGESEQLITPPASSAQAQTAEVSQDAMGSTRPSVLGATNASSEAQSHRTTERPMASIGTAQQHLQNETAIPETLESSASEGISPTASQEVSGQFLGRPTTLSLRQQQSGVTGATIKYGQLHSSPVMSNFTTSNRPRKAISDTPHVQSAIGVTKGSKPALNGTAIEEPSPTSEGIAKQTAKPDLSAEQSVNGFSPEPASAANVTRPQVQSSFNATKGRIPVSGNTTEAPLQTSEDTSNNPPQPSMSTGQPASGATAAPAKAGLGGQNAEWKGTAPPGQQLPQAANEGGPELEGGVTPAPVRGGIGGGEAPWKGTAPPGQAIPQNVNQSGEVSNPRALPLSENATENTSEAQTGIVKAGKPFGSTHSMASVTAAPLSSGVSPAKVTGASISGPEGVSGAPFQAFSEAGLQSWSPGMPNVTASPKSPGIRPNVTRPNVQVSRNATGARNTTDNPGITLHPGQEPSNTTGTVESEEDESKVVTAGPARGGLGGQQSAWKGTAPPGQQLPPRVAQGGPSAGKEITPKPARGGIGGGQAPWKGTAPPDLAFPSGGGSLENVDNASVSSHPDGFTPAPSEAAALQLANGSATTAAQGRVKGGFSKNVTKSPFSGNQTSITAAAVQQSNESSNGHLTSNETVTNPAGNEITAAPARGGVGGGQADWKGTPPPGQQLPPKVAHGGPEPGEGVTPRAASGGVGGGEAPWKGTAPPGQAFPASGRSGENVDNSSFTSKPQGLATRRAPAEAASFPPANGSAATTGPGPVKSGFSRNVTKSPVSGNETSAGHPAANETMTNPAGSEITAAPVRGGVGGGQADWKGTPPPGQQLPPQVAHGGPETGEGVTPRPASGGIGGGETPWKGTAPPGQAFPQGGRSQESADNASVSSRPSEEHSPHPANGSAATTEPGRVKSSYGKNVTKSPTGGNRTAVSELPTGNLTSKEMGTTPSGSGATGAPARGGIGGGVADWKGTPPPGQQFPGPQEPVSSVTSAPVSGGIGGVQSAWKGTAPPGQAFPAGGESQQNFDNSTVSSQPEESAVSRAHNRSTATTEQGRVKSGFSKNVTKAPTGGNHTAVSEPSAGILTSKEMGTTPSGSEATAAPARGGIGGGEADWKGTPPPGQQFPGPHEQLPSSVTSAPASGGIGGVQAAWKGTAPPGQPLSQSIDNSSLSSPLNESAISRAPNGSAATNEHGPVKSGFSKNATKSPTGGNQKTASESPLGNLTSKEMETTPSGSEATAAPAKGGIGGGQAEWKGTPPPGEQFPGPQEPLANVTGAPASAGMGGDQAAWKGTAPPGQAFPQGGQSQQSIDNSSLSSQLNESAISRAPNGSSATTAPGLVKSSGGRNATKSPVSHDNATVSTPPVQQSNESSPSHVSSGEQTSVPPGSQVTAAPARGGVGGGQAEWKGTAPPGQAFPQGKASSRGSSAETSLQSASGSATTPEQGRVKSSGRKNVTKSPAAKNATASTLRPGQQSNDRSTSPMAFAETVTTSPGSEITGALARGGVGGGLAEWKGTAPPGQAFPQGGRIQESIDNASVSTQPGELSATSKPSAGNGSTTTAEQSVKSSGGKIVTKSPTGQNQTAVTFAPAQFSNESSPGHLASNETVTTPSGSESNTAAPARGGVGGGQADWKGTPPPGRQFPGPQEQLPFVTGAPARGGIGGVQSAWKGTQPPLPQATLPASTAIPSSGAAAFTQPQVKLPFTHSSPQRPTAPSETLNRPSQTPSPSETQPGERLITAPSAARAGPAGPIRPTQGPAQNIGQPPIERPSLPEEPSLPSHGGARPTNSNANAPKQPVPVPPSSTDQPESQLLQILINLWEDGRKRA